MFTFNEVGNPYAARAFVLSIAKFLFGMAESSNLPYLADAWKLINTLYTYEQYMSETTV